MGRFLLRRAGYAVLLVWLVVTLTFGLLELAPGDASLHFVDPDLPAARIDVLRTQWGLDQPAPLRYVQLLGNLARGELGASLVHARPVRELLMEALPPTLQLSGLVLLLSFGLGVPLGVWQAARRGRRREHAVGLLLLALYAMPEFWLGMLLIMALSGGLAWFPSSGLVAWDHANMGWIEGTGDRLLHLVLPTITLLLPALAWVARHQRAAMLDVLGSDYVRTARALGLSPLQVLFRHALPSALVPILTLAGVSLPALISGSVVVETVFAWPGMGHLMVEAILGRDSPVIVACFLFYAVLVVLGSLAADLGAAWLDPRLRDGGRR